MIPQEIILEIIDFLDTDKAALKACSLVSSSIRDHSQRHLFRSITLDMCNPYQCAPLHQAFMSNPALPDLVLHLKLGLGVCPVDEIGDIFLQLNNVRGVSLELSSYNYDSSDYWDDPDVDDGKIWDDLRIRDFVARVVCLPTCQYLSLSTSMWCPVQFVARLTHLRHLQFADASSFSTIRSHLQLSQDEGFLESLTVTDKLPNQSPEMCFSVPLSLAGLRVCHISCWHDIAEIQCLLDICPLLEMVHLDIHVSAPPLDFKSLKHLQVVCISAGDCVGGGWLAQALATLPSILQIGLSVHEDVMTKEEWSNFDYFLAQGGDHGGKEVLPRVVWHPRLPQKDKWSSVLEEKLPQLVEKGMAVPASTPSLVFLGSTWNHNPAFARDWPTCDSCFPYLPHA